MCPTCTAGELSLGAICTAESQFFEPGDFKSMTFKTLALLLTHSYSCGICGTDSLLNKLHREFLNLLHIYQITS